MTNLIYPHRLVKGIKTTQKLCHVRRHFLLFGSFFGNCIHSSVTNIVFKKLANEIIQSVTQPGWFLSIQARLQTTCHIGRHLILIVAVRGLTVVNTWLIWLLWNLYFYRLFKYSPHWAPLLLLELMFKNSCKYTCLDSVYMCK